MEVWGGQAFRSKCLLLHFAQHLREFTVSESRSSCLTGNFRVDHWALRLAGKFLQVSINASYHPNPSIEN